MAKKDKKDNKGHEEIPLSKQEQKDLDDVWKKLREQHKKKWHVHLYIIQSSHRGVIKIGRSYDPEKRLSELQVGSPFHLRLIGIVQNAGDREKEIHAILVKHRVRQKNGEWFTEDAIGMLPDSIREHFFPWHSLDPNWYKS